MRCRVWASGLPLGVGWSCALLGAGVRLPLAWASGLPPGGADRLERKLVLHAARCAGRLGVPFGLTATLAIAVRRYSQPMSDGDQASPTQPVRKPRRPLLIGLAIVLAVAVAGGTGWWLGRHHEAKARTEATEAARDKCRASVLREVAGRTGLANLGHNDLTYVDSSGLGVDENGFPAAWVDGEVDAADAAGKKVTYRYGCSVSGYSSDSRSWGSMTVSM